MSGPSTRKDNTEQGPRPMSDDEIRDSVSGENTSYLDYVRRQSNNSYGGGRRGGNLNRDSDD